MRNMLRFVTIAFSLFQASGCASSPSANRTAPDNAEVLRLYEQDQGDRAKEPIDWSVVNRRDAERQERVRELLDAGAIRSGGDYYHAAMVFQHSVGAEGVQLAHELAMIGAALGSDESRWLAAASYDRLLVDLGRGQRFGTQYKSMNHEAMHLVPVEPGVTDAMRVALDCPTLEQAKRRESDFQTPK